MWVPCCHSIGVVSHVAREHYIPNIRIQTRIQLDELASPDLYMAVRKDANVLLGILEGGLQSVTQEERDALRQHWLRLPGTPGAEKPPWWP